MKQKQTIIKAADYERISLMMPNYHHAFALLTPEMQDILSDPSCARFGDIGDYWTPNFSSEVYSRLCLELARQALYVDDHNVAAATDELMVSCPAYAQANLNIGGYAALAMRERLIAEYGEPVHTLTALNPHLRCTCMD